MPTPDEIKARIRESWTGAAEIWDRRHESNAPDPLTNGYAKLPG